MEPNVATAAKSLKIPGPDHPITIERNQTLHRSLFLDSNKMCLPRQEKPAPERTARAASARTPRSKTSDLKACGPPGGGATRQALTFDAGQRGAGPACTP
jgi:hypothetical protein